MKKAITLGILTLIISAGSLQSQHSVARQWNEVLLDAIRSDLARPTVHARNLFHHAIAMWDAWAVYADGDTYLLGQTLDNYTCPFDGIAPPANVQAAQEATMSYALYRLLRYRFRNSPGLVQTYNAMDAKMAELGYDPGFTSTDYSTGDPRALGNYLGECLVAYGQQDGANDINDYANLYYTPFNPTLVPIVPGNPSIVYPNHWQPLTLDVFIDQAGNVYPLNTPSFLSPEWGLVDPFSLTEDDLTIYTRQGHDYWVYCDPGDPPYIDIDNGGDQTAEYQWGHTMVAIWSSHLDPTDGVMIDISPASFGNVPVSDYPETYSEHPDFYNLYDGGDIGPGHEINPHTGLPYAPNIVPRGDYARVLAEFWADGPDSETPPGHWFTILNYVNDHPLFEKRFMGEGPILDELEWDCKAYFLMGATMHDVAISAWGIKGWYDYIRPISAIRMMADLGQSSDPNLPNYHVGGIPLHPGFVELVQPGDPLAGPNNVNVGKIKLYAWRGPDYIGNPANTVAGVGWILAENWWPYQRPSFVTPPFAGFVSGHSTYSRAAALIMTLMTGDAFFPGGMGVFEAPQNEFLVFEDGPSVDVTLQWATYFDASDQTSLSRIWGGIHPPADDIPGRVIGQKIGQKSFDHALCYFFGQDLAPEAACRDLVLYPNNQGNYFVSAEDVDAGSFDYCGIASLSVEPSFIPCQHESLAEIVVLTVSDAAGNTDTCHAQVRFIGDDDCDAVGDACDVCYGVDDNIDLNGDGLPDCAFYPGAGYEFPKEWLCRGGVNVTVPGPSGNPRDYKLYCVDPADVPGLLAQGGYLGAPGSSNCKPQPTVYRQPLTQGGDIEVYPNPARDILMVAFGGDISAVMSLRVVDMQGRVLDELAPTEASRLSIDLQKYPEGLYMVVAETDLGSLTRRVVVQR